MARKPNVPQSIRNLVEAVAEPISPTEIDVYGRWQEIENDSFRVRTVLNAWKQQQTQDREMRRKYANWLMLAMGLQMASVNLIFILLGCQVLAFEPWTANTFIMSVFAETAALVLFVVKYLFARPEDTVLKLIPARNAITEHAPEKPFASRKAGR